MRFFYLYFFLDAADAAVVSVVALFCFFLMASQTYSTSKALGSSIYLYQSFLSVNPCSLAAHSFCVCVFCSCFFSLWLVVYSTRVTLKQVVFHFHIDLEHNLPYPHNFPRAHTHTHSLIPILIMLKWPVEKFTEFFKSYREIKCSNQHEHMNYILSDSHVAVIEFINKKMQRLKVVVRRLTE